MLVGQGQPLGLDADAEALGISVVGGPLRAGVQHLQLSRVEHTLVNLPCALSGAGDLDHFTQGSHDEHLDGLW